LPNEEVTAAAIRRAQFELGLDFSATDVRVVLPDYRYKAEMLGIIENEFCPVMMAKMSDDQDPRPNPDEVAAIRWLDWAEWIDEVKQHPDQYSPWCVEETLLLEENPTALFLC
jgi:isopentenyl-diphosphate delta-isomerase